MLISLMLAMTPEGDLRELRECAAVLQDFDDWGARRKKCLYSVGTAAVRALLQKTDHVQRNATGK